MLLTTPEHHVALRRLSTSLQECMRAAGALLVKGDDPASEDGQRLDKAQRELEKVFFLPDSPQPSYCPVRVYAAANWKLDTDCDES